MTLDLKALSDYQHLLNERASDDAIRRFQALSLPEQCAIASGWSLQRDHSSDNETHKSSQEWSLP